MCCTGLTGLMMHEHGNTFKQLHFCLAGLAFIVGFIHPQACPLGLDLNCNGDSSARGSFPQALPWLVAHLGQELEPPALHQKLLADFYMSCLLYIYQI